MLSHLSYTPDLLPVDYMFFKLRGAMERTRIETVSSIQKRVTREPKAIKKEAFSREFISLYERFKRCITTNLEFDTVY
jgi:hypothetical protein